MQANELEFELQFLIIIIIIIISPFAHYVFFSNVKIACYLYRLLSS